MNVFIKKLSTLIPHFLLFVIGWHMTVGPGTLIFHHLKSFKILNNHVIPIGNIVSQEYNDVMLSPAEVIKIPYIRSFFFSLSMPCFALGYYFLTFFRNNQDPDALLFACSLFPIYVTSLKLSNKILSVLLSIVSIPITFLIIKTKEVTESFEDIESFLNNNILIYFLIFLQYFSFEHSITISANCFHEYTNPPLSIFDFEGSIPILETVYSNFSNILIMIWHHIDIAIIILYLISKHIISAQFSSQFLVGSAIFTSMLSYFCAKRLLQLKLITLTKPKNTDNKKKQKKLRKLVNPIGEIAFGITAIPSHLLILSEGWIYCQTFHSHYSELYSQILEVLIFAGIFLSCIPRLFSFLYMIFPNIVSN